MIERSHIAPSMSAVDDTNGWQLVSKALVPSSLQFHDLRYQVKSKRGKATVKIIDNVDTLSAMKPKVDNVTSHNQVRRLYK